jgi:hypothetical protein
MRTATARPSASSTRKMALPLCVSVWRLTWTTPVFKAACATAAASLQAPSVSGLTLSCAASKPLPGVPWGVCASANWLCPGGSRGRQPWHARQVAAVRQVARAEHGVAMWRAGVGNAGSSPLQPTRALTTTRRYSSVLRQQIIGKEWHVGFRWTCKVYAPERRDGVAGHYRPRYALVCVRVT